MVGLVLALALLAGARESGSARAPGAGSGPVLLGDDIFLRDGWRALDGRCIGIVTNASGVTSSGENFVDAVRANPHICVRALFSPEHGLRGDRPAGAYVPSYTDPSTGLPVYSLYGPTRQPTATMLDGIDVLVFDIQDVGARPYTYVSTMAEIMIAAAQTRKAVWVLDRPDPIGGTLVEGPVLDPRFKSFVGLYPIPERPGMTVGELARLFNARFGIDAKLSVIPMVGWQRAMFWPQTQLPWTATSPNIPYARTTLVYLATGLIDEAGINNGVGSDKPFERAGMYRLDGARYAALLNARGIPGVHFTPTAWTPSAGFWRGKELTGVEIDVDDPAVFPSVRTAIELMCAARTLGALHIHDARVMDRDWGTDLIRRALVAGDSPDQIIAIAQARVPAFLALRDEFLLY